MKNKLGGVSEFFTCKKKNYIYGLDSCLCKNDMYEEIQKHLKQIVQRSVMQTLLPCRQLSASKKTGYLPTQV